MHAIDCCLSHSGHWSVTVRLRQLLSAQKHFFFAYLFLMCYNRWRFHMIVTQTLFQFPNNLFFLSRPISGVDGSKTLGFCFATRLLFKILCFESHAAPQWADTIILWLFWLRRNARSAIVNRIRFLIEKDLCTARREIMLLFSYLVWQHTLVTGHRTLPWCDSFSSKYLHLYGLRCVCCECAVCESQSFRFVSIPLSF